ncbi:MAG: Smr/MutS family protein [Deltaproteobacteria bacterium]|nr:Smr/MutS family protein [Deltaproteobacteria bacterium]
MGRRSDRRGPPARAGAAAFSHQPFRRLRQLVANPPAPQKPPAPPPAAMPAAPPEDDLGAFWREMKSVAPLDRTQRARIDQPPPAATARAVVSDDAEALAELSELVAGSGHFDISDSDEHVEGLASGVDPRLLRRLRAGEFAYQAHLDLHGLNAAEARTEVARFLLRAFQAGLRCVLIVHGRGLNSKDQVPVLKSKVVSWLARGQWSRLLLAFASARPCDGGAGALYVLLRRERKAKRPVHVLNGAKW